MSVVDDYGRFDADPELLRARCFPRQQERWTTSRVSEVLVELRCSSEIEDDGELIGIPPLVTVYRSGTKKILQVNNFGQRVQSKPKYPSPEDDGCIVISPHSTVKHGESPLKSESESNAKTISSASGDAGSVFSLSPPVVSLDKKPKPVDVIRLWFEREFWPLYPRKVDRAEALKAAEKTLPGSGVNRSQIMDGLKAQLPRFQALIDSGEPDRVPHASTWLRKRRWEDESESQVNSARQHSPLSTLPKFVAPYTGV